MGIFSYRSLRRSRVGPHRDALAKHLRNLKAAIGLRVSSQGFSARFVRGVLEKAGSV
jgi:hypothetical protein